MAGPSQNRAELARQCLNVGYGHLAGGIQAWRDAGLELERIPLTRFSALADTAILDVRQRAE